ncbi:MAG: aldose 1-epimerase [Planctomycetaceae bacterium]
MQPVTIRDTHSGSQASIAVHLGFNCYDFRAVVGDTVVDVLDASPEFSSGSERPSGHGTPILFPFPNRIRDGRMTWEGREYHLPESSVPYDNTGNAIHGFCLDRPWRVANQTENSLTGEFQLSVDAPDRLEFWPADFLLQFTYRVKGAALIAEVNITNPDHKPLPWGFGTHAYFKLPLSPDSQPENCLIEVPVSKQWELIDCLPTGEISTIPANKNLQEGLRFGEVQLDDVFTGLPVDSQVHETLIYDEAAGLQLSQRFGSEYREVVVFTPPGRNAVCIEPYTCVTDAINLQKAGIETGWRVLPPGGTFNTQIVLEAGPIIV